MSTERSTAIQPAPTLATAAAPGPIRSIKNSPMDDFLNTHERLTSPGAAPMDATSTGFTITGGRFIREHPAQRSHAYEDRNPVWLCGGVETDSPEGRVIQWSEPEIVLYDDDPYIRMSYPDLVEEDGQYYLTETQKDVARPPH